MTSLLFPMILVTAAAAAAMTILYAVVTRAGAFQPAAADPFAAGPADPSSDTLAGYSEVMQTVRNPAADWQVATLTDLSQVTDLLDSLEAHGVADREVVTLGESCFAVRWK